MQSVAQASLRPNGALKITLDEFGTRLETRLRIDEKGNKFVTITIFQVAGAGASIWTTAVRP